MLRNETSSKPPEIGTLPRQSSLTRSFFENIVDNCSVPAIENVEQQSKKSSTDGLSNLADELIFGNHASPTACLNMSHSSPLISRKTVKKLSQLQVKKRLSKLSASGLFTHPTYIVTKKIMTQSEFLAGSSHEWFLKSTPSSINNGQKDYTAIAEVYAQECQRLLSPFLYPKTRLVTGSSDSLYVLSKKVKNFVSLTVPDPAHVLEDSYYQTHFNGLATASVNALVVDEWDFKFGNIGKSDIGAEAYVVKIDGDWCFGSLRKNILSKTITSLDIQTLPNPRVHVANNWLDYYAGGRQNSRDSVYDQFARNNAFQLERNAAILRWLLLPKPGLLQKMAYCYTANVSVAACYAKELANRIEALRCAALQIPQFLIYLEQPVAELTLREFQTKIINFTTGNKNLLISPNQRSEQIYWMREQFSSLKKSLTLFRICAAELEDNAKEETKSLESPLLKSPRFTADSKEESTAKQLPAQSNSSIAAAQILVGLFKTKKRNVINSEKEECKKNKII